MDNNTPDDFSVKKEALYKEFFETMVRGLEKGHLTKEQSEEASRMIVEGFDKAKDIYYLQVVVEDLCEIFPIFHPLLLIFEEQAVKNDDEDKIEDAQKKLEELINPAK